MLFNNLYNDVRWASLKGLRYRLYNPKCMTKRSEEPLELQVMVSAENPINPLLILLRSLSVSYSSVLK